MIVLESYNPRVGRREFSERYPKISNNGSLVFSSGPRVAARQSKPGSYLLRELLEFQVDRGDVANRRSAASGIF